MTVEPVAAPGSQLLDTRTVDADGSHLTAPAVVPPALFTNREFSWLDFNDRVFNEALDSRNPLLERVKFLAITASNLDEFAAKRIGWLKLALEAEPMARTIDGLTIVEQLRTVIERCRRSLDEMVRLWETELKPELAEHGIRLVSFDDLDADARARLQDYFEQSIFPTLTPLAVVPLEEVIAAFGAELFAGMEVRSWHKVRVIRSAEIGTPGEEGDDLMELVENELKRRRLAPAVRLEVSDDLPDPYLDMLLEELELRPEDVYRLNGLIDLEDLFQIASLEYPALRFPAYAPAVPTPFLRAAHPEGFDLFAAIREKDLLVHHPYESFDNTVAEFIQTAAEDPSVLTIKQTLYRTSADSPILESLIEASERGKQVAVLVELTARFDEANNIEWARKLERAGVHVAYGVPGYKIHSKIALVVREELGGLKLYGHVSTGNYNSRTARIYTDFGLFTCDEEICADLVQVFNYLTGYADRPRASRLLVAPFGLRSTFGDLVRAETEAARRGEEARIVMKMNALEDQEFTTLLYEAAAAGVKVDLIIRGICRLQPGEAGTGANLRVVSVVGKYLEHSRVFLFHNGGRPLYWIGSADLMKRNLDERIEVLVPIDNPVLQSHIDTVLTMLLNDTRQGWRLNGKEWTRDDSSEQPAAHNRLEALAPFS
jgi:polyphosphate kinase